MKRKIDIGEDKNYFAIDPRRAARPRSSEDFPAPENEVLAVEVGNLRHRAAGLKRQQARRHQPKNHEEQGKADEAQHIGGPAERDPIREEADHQHPDR